MFPNPSRGFHGFDLLFAGHGSGPRQVNLRPNQTPGTVYSGAFAGCFVGAIMVLEPGFQGISLAIGSFGLLISAPGNWLIENHVLSG
jgi:hypothetical protein